MDSRHTNNVLLTWLSFFVHALLSGQYVWGICSNCNLFAIQSWLFGGWGFPRWFTPPPPAASPLCVTTSLGRGKGQQERAGSGGQGRQLILFGGLHHGSRVLRNWRSQTRGKLLLLLSSLLWWQREVCPCFEQKLKHWKHSKQLCFNWMVQAPCTFLLRMIF